MLAQKTRMSRERRESELWDHNHLSQFQGHGSGFTTEIGEVVFVAFADFLEDAMHAQTFKQTRHLAGGFVGEVLTAQLLIRETADKELALQQGAEQVGVLFREEIEALVTMLVLGPGFSQFVQFFDADLWCGDGRDELKVTPIGGEEQFLQSRQRVNGLLHGSPTGRCRPITMLYLAVVLEEGDLVDGGFDAQDEAELRACKSITPRNDELRFAKV